MKIQRLGSRISTWNIADVFGDFSELQQLNELEVGKRVTQGYTEGAQHGGGDWIITDVLGDGKFKAMPKEKIIKLDQIVGAGTYRKNLSIDEKLSIARKDGFDLDRYSETFDVSGKVDKENPIYKFYESEVPKYIKNKYGAKLITDPQGVSWWELDIKPEHGTNPIEAFGIAGLGLGTSQNQRDEQSTAQQAASMKLN